MKKSRKLLLSSLISTTLVTTVGISTAAMVASCSNGKFDININFKEGTDILSYSADPNPRHTQHECEMEVVSNTNRNIIVTWNKLSGVEDYVTITNIEYGDTIRSGDKIIVQYNKAEVPQGHNVPLVFTFKNSLGERKFEITLINDEINPIPFDLLKWTVVPHTTHLWTLDGIAEEVDDKGNIVKADVSEYDTILVPTDVVEITPGAFKNLPKNIVNLIFVDPTGKGQDVFYEIGANAFDGAQLINIELPSSIKRIGTNAFSNNYNIGLANDTPFDSIERGAHIYLQPGSTNYEIVNFYRNNDPGLDIVGQIVIPKGGLTNNYESLSTSPQGLAWGKIVIDNKGEKAILSSTELADDAFNGTASITDIDVNCAITYLGSRVFANMLIHDHDFINFNFTNVPKVIGRDVTSNTYVGDELTTSNLEIILCEVNTRQLAYDWYFSTKDKFNILITNVSPETTLDLTDFTDDSFNKTLTYGKGGKDELFSIGYITDVKLENKNEADIPFIDDKWQGEYYVGTPHIEMSAVDYDQPLSTVNSSVTVEANLVEGFSTNAITLTALQPEEWEDYCEFSPTTGILKVNKLPPKELTVIVEATLDYDSQPLKSKLAFKVFDESTTKAVEIRLDQNANYSIAYGERKKINVSNPENLDLEYIVDPEIAEIQEDAGELYLVVKEGVTALSDITVSVREKGETIDLAQIFLKVKVVIPGLSWLIEFIKDEGYIIKFVWSKDELLREQHFEGTFSLAITLVDLTNPTIRTSQLLNITTEAA